MICIVTCGHVFSRFFVVVHFDVYLCSAEQGEKKCHLVIVMFHFVVYLCFAMRGVRGAISLLCAFRLNFYTQCLKLFCGIYEEIRKLESSKSFFVTIGEASLHNTKILGVGHMPLCGFFYSRIFTSGGAILTEHPYLEKYYTYMET